METSLRLLSSARSSMKVTSNALPFLQAQILKRIYTNISQKKSTSMKELSELTGLNENSKILSKAVVSLVSKGFILYNGDEEIQYSVPYSRLELYENIIVEKKLDKDALSDFILEYFTKLPKQEKIIARRAVELNDAGVVHKWYNYLEDFPYKLISDKFAEYGITTKDVVLDPFCGSGTTLVASTFCGVPSIGFDANPLMAFVSKVKTTWDINLDQYKQNVIKISKTFLDKVGKLEKITFKNNFLKNMPKKEINQWLSERLQKEVSLLKDIIEDVAVKDIEELLLMAMSKSCFDASYVALCPGTTFYPLRKKEPFWKIFSTSVIQIFEDLQEIQALNKEWTKANTVNDTILSVRDYLKDDSISFVITSPPYPNDLEYTRQTRLELYLLDFVKNMDEVQKIKKKMIKSSTKLIFKDISSVDKIRDHETIGEIASAIYEKTKDKDWGFDYPRMVKEYFGDMYLAMEGIYPKLKSGGHFLLVVGNQTVQGVLIPVGDILIDLAQKIGYVNCHKETFRTRRSANHNIPLDEEVVTLEKK